MIKQWLRKWLSPEPVGYQPEGTGEPLPPPPPPRSILWRNMAINAAQNGGAGETARFQPPALPANVVPADAKMAMDSACSNAYDYANSIGCGVNMQFPGYSNLAQQASRPEFRKASEVIAAEMVREWIKVTGSQDDNQKEKVAQIESALVDFRVREVFREAMEHDGFFGMGHIYADVKTPSGGRADDVELQKPLTLTPGKIKRDSLIAFRNVEPQWTYPYEYNSIDPLSPNFYKPQSWFVMGKLVHASRLATLTSRQVPDILKPAYNFGGLSLTQIMDPYVANWIRTRDSVGDLVHSFSINGIKTDLSALLQDGASCDLSTRVGAFTNYRDNKGLFVMDKDSEEFFQYNVPLSGLDKLQAQAQEQMCSVAGIPLVKYTGITPSGLNASSDGEIRVFYDWIASLQAANFTEPLTWVLSIIQLHLFGEIDPDIGFEYVPLYQLSPAEIANKNKVDADADAVLIGNGIVSPAEARVKLQSNPESGYSHIDVLDVPEEPIDPEQPIDNGDPEET